MLRSATPTGRFYKLFYRWTAGTIHQGRPCTPAYSTYQSWHSTRAAAPSLSKSFRQNLSTSSSCLSSPPKTNSDSLPTQMRHLMRRVPHPVVILTAAHPHSSTATHDPATEQPYFRGMTVSSFNTVCLEPRPIVSFNMKLPSRTYDALKANSGYFLVHMLHGGPAGAALADAFTRGQEEVHRVLSSGLEVSSGGAGDSGVASVKTVIDDETRTSPMMVLPGAITYVLRCRLLEKMELQVEDHVVLCAEVFDVVDSVEESEGEGLSLVYVDRAFRNTGHVIEWRRHGSR